MARRIARPLPDRRIALKTLTTRCPQCQQTLRAAYTNRRTVVTRDGPVRLAVQVSRCSHPECPRFGRPFRAEAEGRIALPEHEFGLDLIALIGALRYIQHRSVPEIHRELTSRGVAICPRSVTNLLDRYDELLALSLSDTERLRRVTAAEGRVILAIDGLQPEHDKRRAPATYERILKNIADQQVTIHSTITAQMMKRAGYLEEFLKFWTPRPEIKKVWFSLFTPQIGDELPEILTKEERFRAIREKTQLRKQFAKLDMPEAVIRQFAAPPHSPDDCVFALTTQTLSADLQTKITPCQFGGNPDCSACGCIASMGLASVAAHKLAGILPVGAIFKASIAIGQWRARSKSPAATQAEVAPVRGLTPASESSNRPTMQAAETIPHISGETLPVLQPPSEKICIND